MDMKKLKKWVNLNFKGIMKQIDVLPSKNQALCKLNTVINNCLYLTTVNTTNYVIRKSSEQRLITKGCTQHVHI